MHPVVILIPIAALAFVPGIWARQVLARHNATPDPDLPKGRELARRILDAHGLDWVRVECTDVGDHYDPEAKAVRLSRDKFDRNTLTAVTTAAHEAAHAIQDAGGYPPFVWRSRLVSLARVTGQVGSVVLIAVPAAALLGNRSIPPGLVGVSLFAMLTTGVAAQFAALPTELDASFRRALPMLRETCGDPQQLDHARDILIATSSTYVAASLLSVLNIWPWVGIPRAAAPLLPAAAATKPAARPPAMRTTRTRHRGALARLTRVFGKPVIRAWMHTSYRLRNAAR